MNSSIANLTQMSNYKDITFCEIRDFSELFENIKQNAAFMENYKKEDYSENDKKDIIKKFIVADFKFCKDKSDSFPQLEEGLWNEVSDECIISYLDWYTQQKNTAGKEVFTNNQLFKNIFKHIEEPFVEKGKNLVLVNKIFRNNLHKNLCSFYDFFKEDKEIKIILDKLKLEADSKKSDVYQIFGKLCTIFHENNYDEKIALLNSLDYSENVDEVKKIIKCSSSKQFLAHLLYNSSTEVLNQSIEDLIANQSLSFNAKTRIYLKEKNLFFMPLEISRMACLKSVIISRCNLIKLDLNLFGELKKIENIDLSCNNIYDIENSYIPLKESSLFKKLKCLNLRCNRIQDIKILQNLVKLKELDLSGNKIKKIEGLENLVKLKDLDLSENKIKKIEGLENLVKLKDLNLYSNNIEKIEGLENLVELKRLDLHNNKIKRIENLENLKELISFILYSNKIKKIENIENLKLLDLLDLSSNKIKRIENLENLKELKNLFLSDNKIKKIENLVDLEKIQKVLLLSNKIKRLDQYVIQDLKKLPLLNAFLISGKEMKKSDIELLQELEKELSQKIHIEYKK